MFKEGDIISVFDLPPGAEIHVGDKCFFILDSTNGNLSPGVYASSANFCLVRLRDDLMVQVKIIYNDSCAVEPIIDITHPVVNPTSIYKKE